MTLNRPLQAAVLIAFLNASKQIYL